MKKKPDVAVTVGGYDCTGNSKTWTPRDLRRVGQVFLEAAEALENKQHGCIEEKGLVYIGFDFGGPFDEEKGLPKLPRTGN